MTERWNEVNRQNTRVLIRVHIARKMTARLFGIDEN